MAWHLLWSTWAQQILRNVLVQVSLTAHKCSVESISIDHQTVTQTRLPEPCHIRPHEPCPSQKWKKCTVKIAKPQGWCRNHQESWKTCIWNQMRGSTSSVLYQTTCTSKVFVWVVAEVGAHVLASEPKRKERAHARVCLWQQPHHRVLDPYPDKSNCYGWHLTPSSHHIVKDFHGYDRIELISNAPIPKHTEVRKR